MDDALAALFAPRRIALVGASDVPGRMGELFWRNLASFPGEVVPVTPKGPGVADEVAYTSLREVAGPIDLVVVVVPAPTVPDVIRDAAAKGARAAIVISGGFAETGRAGAELQAQAVEAARAGGVRLVGPNCFGVQNCDLPLNASMATGLPPGGGAISLVAQSGAYGMALHGLAVDERTRFAKVMACGNKADIGDDEVLRYLAGDPASRVLCFFLESLSGGRAFAETARRVTPDKPVIVAKSGRTPAGARAALSHTGALAASETILRGVLTEAGVVVARSGLEMLDAARALADQPPPSGNRVGIVSNSGGVAVELADLMQDEGLSVPELSQELQDTFAAQLPAIASARNPLDITPVWRRFAELYPAMVGDLARSGEVDVVVAVLVQRAAMADAVASGLRAAVARLRSDGNAVPVYVCWVAPRGARANADLMQEAGVPCFEWPERTARAVGHACRYGAARRLTAPSPEQPERPPGVPRLPEGLLDPDRAARLLSAVGITTAPYGIVDTAEAAGAASERLGFPVVAKVVHPELVHKSDAGGVRLGLASAEAAEAAAGDLLGMADGARLLVQRQCRGTELVIGGLRDAQFGPVVMIGLGGVLVEILGEVAFGLAPLSARGARSLLDGLRCQAVLDGARGTDRVDRDAVARTAVAVGNLLVAVPEIAELDLNPVMVRGEEVVAVDWRVVVAAAVPA